MNAYAYRAALYCEECIKPICQDLAEGGLFAEIAKPENSARCYDSEFRPQRVSDGGGEADCPQHCDTCGLFLENSLTDDGRDYVRQALAAGNGNPAVLGEWQAFYGSQL